MEWLGQNWFWVVVFIAFVAMHLVGHGGHGGCGSGHGGEREGDDADRPPSGRNDSKPGPPPGHQH